MADVGTHSMVGATLGILAVNIVPDPTFTEAITVGVITIAISFGLHLAVDAIPHGHSKNKKKEIGWDGIIFILTMLGIAVLSIFKGGGWYLFLVTSASIFFADIFDVFVTAAEGVSEEKRWANWSRRVNYFFHWFVTRTTWLDRISGVNRRQEAELFHGRKIHGWAWGWYNYAGIILIGIAPLTYIIQHFYF